MKVFFKAMIIFMLIPFFYNCNNMDKKAFIENNVEGTTDFERLQDQFLLGSHLCREPMPPVEELKRDMEILSEASDMKMYILISW